MKHIEYGYELCAGRPLEGRALAELQAFLAERGLTYAPGIDHSAVIRDGAGRIAAAASLDRNIVKCAAVRPDLQGTGLMASLITHLRQESVSRGGDSLFLYTKPQNKRQFAELGFYEVAETEQVLLMEDRRGGLAAWAETVRDPRASGHIGCLAANCDPMTLGHRYLIEQSAARCDTLYLLVVSEDRSTVPAAHRRRIVEQSVRDLSNVAVAETGRYLISAASFPDYFLKEKRTAAAVWCSLDIAVFCRLAEMLGISRRFVGTEPLCPVTAAYNRAMAAALPRAGVDLVEIPRMERDGVPISATAVRRLIANGRWREIRSLVPQAAYDYFSEEAHRQLFLERYQELAETSKSTHRRWEEGKWS
ncbi:[citrate (pro-3S)-lyase] ligase [uncultured Oscillibacter sp.]|uniref:[citrate (pro-3S)-lyase] ligase n=1 Tax=uncultured Oscillibacter sp. TaxID=876091 RepID=UPI0025CCB226|nr:[citrate (pro-3S)-lyase] ligase [uncultured Oscillibacter sp.]